MTVSSPPSRPEPDGGDTGSGNSRSPPSVPSSNPENSNTSTTMTSHNQLTEENTELSGKNRIQAVPTNAPESESQHPNLEARTKEDASDSPSKPGNESGGKWHLISTNCINCSG